MQGLRVSTLVAACAVGAGGLMSVVERFATVYIFNMFEDPEQAMRVIHLYGLTLGLLVYGGLCTFFLALLIANSPHRNPGAYLGDQTMSLLRVATLIALIASALMGVWAVGIQALRILIPEDQFWAYSADMNLVYMGLAAFLYGALVFFFVVLSINQGAQEPQAAYPGYGTQATTSNPFSPASPAPQPVSQPAPQSAPQPVSQPAPQTPPLPAPRVPQPPPVKRLDL